MFSSEDLQPFCVRKSDDEALKENAYLKASDLHACNI